MSSVETSQLESFLSSQIDARAGHPPYELVDYVVRTYGSVYAAEITSTKVLNLLLDPSVNSICRPRLAARLHKWDSSSDVWCADTEVSSASRRHLIYQKLGIEARYFERLDDLYSFKSAKKPVIIAGDTKWDRWYTPDRKKSHEFYQQAYRRTLLDKGWDVAVVDEIDETTDKIVGLLADPKDEAPYQSKGLVVGHVQSGKTANFTSVIAKCIDSGYKLIIVLTGTIELLRNQTQRRLDMEIVGKQNIVPALDEVSRRAAEKDEYYAQSDEDWPDFLEHVENPYTQSGLPAIRRLTTYLEDYRELGSTRISILDPRLSGEVTDGSLPLFDQVNVQDVNVRIGVLKKNKVVLERLLRDLSKVSRVAELSVVILDDEADQASVNTLNPKSNNRDDRTAINDAIVKLMETLPRAQYLAYTATPYANVLIDADSPEQLFPKDFIISLDPPEEYMGGKFFHDLDLADEDVRTISNSNELARVRKVDVSDDAEVKKSKQAALDSFVLTGAIKLYRESIGLGTFKHHTMLVHESVKQVEHEAAKMELNKLWKSSRYSEPSGLARLRRLWVKDFATVAEARPKEAGALPSEFEDLGEFLGRAVDKISSGHPVIVVNGDKNADYDQSELDFQGGSVWKILVGGAKLSRGFTVEGLTVSYYMRKSVTADTLMQAGRWFGFRHGYRDLVRLYIGFNLKDRTGKKFDLYDAFTAITSDENLFRQELEDFSHMDDDGRPLIRPSDVRPLVFQELPWLRPAAANKMHHARLVTRGKGGKLSDFMRQPDRGNGSVNEKHFAAFLPLLTQLGSDLKTFWYSELDPPVAEKTGEKCFDAYVTDVDANEVLDALKKFEWADGWDFGPDLSFLHDQINGRNPTIERFVILLPKLKDSVEVAIQGAPFGIPIIKRKRRNFDRNSVSARPGFSGTSFRQRQPIEHIAGGRYSTGGEEAERLKTPTTAAMLLTYAADQAGGSNPEALQGAAVPADIATLFAYAPPKASAPRGRIGFTAGRV